jgi:hypothetical protein
VRRPGKPWKHQNQTREVDVESNGNQQDEGGTMKRKVATGVAVGLATTAAAGVAKKLMDNQDDETGQQDESGGRQSQSGRGRSRTSTSRRSGGATKRASSGARRTTKSQTRRAASSTRSSGTRGANRTKEQLYNQAKRLGIDGRSSMNKAQLERAIQRARS